MLKNYLRIAVRNLAKYKFISFINLFGLTVGITCCLLILTYILHETSYDKYNRNAGRTWRVTRSWNDPDGHVSLHLGTIAPPFGPLLRNDFPDIQKMTQLLEIDHQPMRYEDKIFNEENLFFADTNFFDIFDVTLLEGNPATALAEPNSILLTPDVARKYFGDKDPMNKVVRMDNQLNFKVTGIYEPLPSAAHFHPKLLLSFSTLNDSTIYGAKQLRTNYGNNAFFTYILLPKDYPVQSMVAQFPAFLDRHIPTNGAPPGFIPHQGTKLYLQPLTDIHLHSNLDSEAEENGDAGRVRTFAAIALFILLIACINYMNLSTARSSLRAREIGIRKVSGALRREIILQFLSESVLISYMAYVLAAALTWLTIPALNSITGLSLSIDTLLRPAILIPLCLTPLLVGILSGLYPALFLSSFQPSRVLKGLFKAGTGSISFRKVLVVFQFAISIVLLISTTVVFQQLHFMQSTSLGFNKAQIVVMPYNAGLDKSYESFRSRLLQDPHIRMISRSSRIPSGRLLDSQGASAESGDSLKPVTTTIKFLTVDQDFLSTFGIGIAAGRDYSRLYATDTTNYILNLAATQSLGVHNPREMIGRNFSYGGIKGKVIGVMNDFNFESLHQSIVPLVLTLPAPSQLASNSFAHISIKLSGDKDNIREALNYLQSAWKTYLPEVPFEYSFLDERFSQLYRSEERQGDLFTVFSGIAIFIACLGLLGLSAFSISQRVKEIGIRKVLGAHAGTIVWLLSADFLKLVALASVIAFVAAAIIMYNWLQSFAYRISLDVLVFAVAALLAAVIALVTISFQALKAAWSNPVNSLRSE
ncbi:MAG TPA: ABC transporter permease [Puia sp.]|jgi:putative ABC transport system permease protein|nr:ABC transporter permease [Puia sp.]